MLAFLAPGQGAQSPGFLKPWLADAGFADQFGYLAAVADLDLVHYGTEADADTIRDTKVAQPLLVAASLATASSLLGARGTAEAGVGLVAGHSVGELAAAALGGALSVEQAMVLVRERGRGMADAAALTPTGMTAVVGGQRDEVLATIERHGLVAANDNGPGQVVAAGTTDQLAALAEDPPTRARVIPLSVAGAFHTEHMAPGVERLEALTRAVVPGEPTVQILSNADGQVVASGAEVVQRIVSQIAHPVRWDLCMSTMLELGVTGIVELTPAGTLTGIAKRGMKGVASFALNTPDQLDDARAFVAEHATTGAGA